METPTETDPGQYVLYPRAALRAGEPLLADLYLFLPIHQTRLLFRARGETLNAADLESLAKFQDEHLLVPGSQASALAPEVARPSRSTSAPESPEVQAAVIGYFRQLDFANPDPEARQRRKEALGQMPRMVDSMIQQSKKLHSASAYERILKSLKNLEDPLSGHLQQVSVLGTLFMLLIGTSSMEDVLDVALAGLVHDLGFRALPPHLHEFDLAGKPLELHGEELKAYHRHGELSLEAVRSEGIQLSPSVIRIIQLHHETWSGTGPQRGSGTQVYRPARVLRIADELVARLFRPQNQTGLYAHLLQMKQEIDPLKAVEKWDPSMMALLCNRLKPE